VHSCGLGRVLADSGGCESRPCHEMAGVNSLTPGGEGCREEAGMIECNSNGNGVVHDCCVEHGVDQANAGTGFLDGWGGGWCDGIEGPDPVGGGGPGAGYYNDVVTRDGNAVIGENGFASVIAKLSNREE
jgi:hypothetical protein